MNSLFRRHLPRELIDNIVDFVAEDGEREALRNLAVAGRVFLPRTAHHQFGGRTHLLVKDAPGLDKLAGAILPGRSRIATFARTLQLDLTVESAHEHQRMVSLTGDIVCALPALETVAIISREYRGSDLTETIKYAGVVSRVPPATAPHIPLLVFTNASAPLIIAALGQLPHAHTVALRSIPGVVRRHHQPRTFVVPRAVDTLCVRGQFDNDDFAAALCPRRVVIDSAHCSQAFTFSPFVLDQLLRTVGRDLIDLEYAHPQWGWDVLAGDTHGLPALTRCTKLHSAVLAACVDDISNPPAPGALRPWLEALDVLATLPPQTRRVRFVTSLLPFTTAAVSDAQLRNAAQVLGWAQFEHVLSHLSELEVVELAVVRGAGSVVGVKEPIENELPEEVWDVILQTLSEPFRAKVKFL